MTNGGAFRLIVNDGKQDRMLMATALLNRRLMDIERVRSKDKSITDCTPTLVDIERTHILFMNAHFKPFAAIGFEYNTVGQPSASTGGSVRFSLPQYGDFLSDMCLHVVLPALGARYRWFDLPGLKLLKEVAFTVNGNPLDKYTHHEALMHYKFYVPDEKLRGFNRAVGQQNVFNGQSLSWPLPGPGSTAPYLPEAIQQVQFVDGAQTRADDVLEMFIPLLFWFNLDPRLAIPSVAIPYGQRFIDIEFAKLDEIVAFQQFDPEKGTWTFTKPSADNPGVGVMGEKTFTICELIINNIFVNPEIHDIYIRRIGFNLIRVHRRQIISARTIDNVLLNQMKWPIESLYVGISPHSQQSDPVLWKNYSVSTAEYITTLSARRPQLQFNPVARSALTGGTILTAGNTADLFMTETGEIIDLPWNYGAFTKLPADNITPLLLAHHIRHVRFGGPTNTSSILNINVTFDPEDPIFTNGPNGDVTLSMMNEIITRKGRTRVLYYKDSPAFQTLGLTAHGVKLYDNFSSGFYNTYIPITYGGPNIRVSEDPGVMMIAFNLYPGSYQPSGHINTSRAREFYLNYEAAYDFDNIPADLVVVGIALNFLLISDGSAILRYST